MPEKGMLWRMISIASRDKQEEERVIAAIRRCLHWQEPSDYITFSEWLLQVTDNKTIYDIFENISVQLIGPNIWEFSAGETFRGLRSFAGTKQLMPRKGLGFIIDLLAKVVRENKGEILSLVEARKILVQDGMATGVEAVGPDGELQIEAKVVVSNVGPKMTVKLAGEQNFERGYLRLVREMRVHTGFEYFVASNGPLCPYPGGLYTINTRRTWSWVDCTMTWPEWAPKGKNWMLCYQAPPNMTFYDPKKEYEIFLADLNETFPRFNEQGGEILVSHHYNSNWPVMMSVPGDDLPQKTPIVNLYNVGDGVKPKGLTAGSAAAETGRIVAEDIKTRMKPGR
jgi:phytoene desaturase